jgi:hypothetical protein
MDVFLQQIVVAWYTKSLFNNKNTMTFFKKKNMEKIFKHMVYAKTIDFK